jgi:hypothetical protein
VQEVYYPAANTANVHKEFDRLIPVDDLLDPVRAGYGVELGAAFDLLKAAAAAPSDGKPVIAEPGRVTAAYERARSR